MWNRVCDVELVDREETCDMSKRWSLMREPIGEKVKGNDELMR